MKLIFAKRMLLPFLIILGFLISLPIQAQDTDKAKKTTIRIRVSKDLDGKEKNIEKKYEVSKMTDQERRQFVDKVLDSLGIDSNSPKNISVTMDDGDGNNLITTKERRKEVMDRSDDREPLVFQWNDDLPRDLNFDTEKFRSHLRNFEGAFQPKAKMMMRDMENFGDKLGEFWNKEILQAANVRELTVYSNNPDNGILNLRFHVQQKGDLSITVTDTKGKEVGKKEIKDFSGDFIGQVNLKKNTKGTIFVTVVQNEDGAVKRIVIP